MLDTGGTVEIGGFDERHGAGKDLAADVEAGEEPVAAADADGRIPRSPVARCRHRCSNRVWMAPA